MALAPDLHGRASRGWPTRLAGAIGWGICAYYLLLALLSLPYVGHWMLDDLLGLLVFLTYPVVGALIIARHPRHTIGWLFCGFGGFFATVGFTESYVTASLSAAPMTLPGWMVHAWLWNVLTAGAPFLFGTFLPLLFPSGHLPSPRWRPLAWVAATGAILVTLWAAFGAGAMRVAPTVQNPLALPGVPSEFFAALWVAILLAPVCDAIAVASLFFRMRRARGDEHQQLKWMLSAAVFVALGFAVTLALTLLGIPFGISSIPVILSYAAIPVAAGIAIFRYRLYDIDIIINRTLVYAALTGSIVALYSLVVVGVGALFQTSGNLAISLAATGLIAVLFQPLRARLQHAVNRLLYGDRDEPYAVLTLLGRRLEGALDPETVLPTIVRTVMEALKLPYAAITLQHQGAPAVAAAVGEPVPQPLRLPLVYQQEPIGEFLLGARAPGDPFSPADRRLLDDLARQVGLAAHAVRLNMALQRSRARLVTAREEERRRLGRDLHDGLGPALSSVLLKVGAARRQLAPDSPADTLLAEMCDDVRALVGDIRRIAYGLRPPALDQLGLALAIRDYADRCTTPGSGVELTIDVETAEPLPPLPAAVEVAAYHLAREALNNVVCHASASRCTIRLTVVGAVATFPVGEAGTSGTVATLWLEVRDNGRGLPVRPRSGIGLISIRERAAELGGTCQIESPAAGGTCVTASLPILKEGPDEPATHPDH